MPGIFISYRRDDQAGFAGRLADALGLAFDADNVFRDIEDIHPGEDFVDAINQQLTSVDVFLVIIGPAWLTVSRHGVRRLDEPEDFVRMEIEAGLKSGKMLLPVLVGGASMPAEKELPLAIRALARRQSFILSDTNWTGHSTGAVAPVSAEMVQALSGQWRATVKYDWGAEHAERFDLRLENDEVHGTASYLGVPRTVEQGTLAGEQLNFVTHSQEVLGDGPGRDASLSRRAAGG